MLSKMIRKMLWKCFGKCIEMIKNVQKCVFGTLATKDGNIKWQLATWVSLTPVSFTREKRLITIVLQVWQRNQRDTPNYCSTIA